MLERRQETCGSQTKFRGWGTWGVVLLAFVLGCGLTASLQHVRQVRADSNRVFELMVYHTLPGKVPDLEAIFRDVSKMQEKHGLKVVGYWVPNEEAGPEWKNTFVYLVAHESREGATNNWQALHSDAEFPPYRKAAVPLIERIGENFRVDEVYMRPTDYSAMR
jgi:hypothetical protein